MKSVRLKVSETARETATRVVAVETIWAVEMAVNRAVEVPVYAGAVVQTLRHETDQCWEEHL